MLENQTKSVFLLAEIWYGNTLSFPFLITSGFRLADAKMFDLEIYYAVSLFTLTHAPFHWEMIENFADT